MASEITKRAMICTLSISQYTGQKFDRQTSNELTRTKGATSDSARVNLHLFPKDAFTEVTKAATSARAEHYRLTVPYGDVENLRMLPSTLFFTHTERMQAAAAKFNDAADAFHVRYPGYLADASRRMNGLYRADFYPAAGIVRSLFSFAYSYDPMPEPTGLSADLFGGDLTVTDEMIRAAVDRQNSAIMSGVRDVWQRIADVVKHAAERLNAYDVDPTTGKVTAPFRDSLISNIRDLISILPDLNFTGDPDLQAMTGRLQSEIASYDPEVLRTDPRVRSDVAKAADAIVNDLAAYL